MSGTILVTGGTGVVGRPLVHGLAATGQRVILLSRGRLPIETGGGGEHLCGDVAEANLGLSSDSYARLAAEVSVIYHLAARTDFKSHQAEDYASINIHGCRHIFDFARIAGAHLHHVSTAFVCGTHAGDFGEHQLDCGQGFRNGYEHSKYLAEVELRRLADHHKVPLTVYRPSIILERQPNSVSATGFGPFLFLDAVFRLLLSSSYRQQPDSIVRIGGARASQLPFIFDDDVARALLILSTKEGCRGQTYHLVAGTPFANGSLEDIFNRAFGRQVARWVDHGEFDSCPMTRGERIVARKTAMYAPYLDLQVHFQRTGLDRVLGERFCQAVTSDELFRAFQHFLQAKRGMRKQADYSDDQLAAVREYFTTFLPAIQGRRLLDNLVSLSCSFWITVECLGSYSLTIDRGRLTAIDVNREGRFGYRLQAEAFLQVVSGEVAPQQGFFNGDIEIEGETFDALQTAVALEEFFRLKPFVMAKISCEKKWI